VSRAKQRHRSREEIEAAEKRREEDVRAVVDAELVSARAKTERLKALRLAKQTGDGPPVDDGPKTKRAPKRRKA
jgi:hypothetical protein